MIDDIQNKSKVAIVVIGYNRLDSIQRLLRSLEKAEYPNKDIPLIISIDKGGCDALERYVSEYQWSFGEKYCFLQTERLGLREHIYRCARQSRHFRGVILLEDDLVVSPQFYDYTLQTLDAYENEPHVAEISLFSLFINEFVNLPFYPIHRGADVYALQSVSTWGECFTWKMWSAFEEWLKKWDNDFDSADLPEEEKGWDHAWSKYYDAYITETKKMVITPYVGVTANPGDPGIHGSAGVRAHSELEFGKREYVLPPFRQLVQYDGFMNCLEVLDVLGISQDETCLDLWGMEREKTTNRKYRFLLSTKKYPYPVIRSFGFGLMPMELNIIHNVPGKDIFLYDLGQAKKCAKGHRRLPMIQYHLHGFELRYLLWSVPLMFWIRLRNKILRICRIRK